jgi:hypothetical protein
MISFQFYHGIIVPISFYVMMYAKKQSPDASSASISLSISPFLLHPFFFSKSILREDKLLA